MTEAEWLNSTDLEAMLAFLQDKGPEQGWLSCSCWRVRCRQQRGFCPAYRKFRLFSHAYCQRVMHLLPHPDCQKVLGILADYIEDATELTSYEAAYSAFDQTRRSRFPKGATAGDGAWNALYCAVHRRWLERYDDYYASDRWRVVSVVTRDAASSTGQDEARAQAQLLRDIVGNPFHPVLIHSGWLAWNDRVVPKLARTIYDEHTSDRLPILADALEEAGCDNADILNHLRGPGPHVRGCLVVDLILGKE
jgi:hypothetical protein